jgi:hypothetical protein
MTIHPDIESCNYIFSYKLIALSKWQYVIYSVSIATLCTVAARNITQESGQTAASNSR